MVAKYDIGDGNFKVSETSTAPLSYVWFKAIQDFSDGIAVTALALNTGETRLAAVGAFQSSTEHLNFSILNALNGNLIFPV
jgi:hypothetical protein